MHATLAPLRPVLVCTAEAVDTAEWERRGLEVQLPGSGRSGGHSAPPVAIFFDESATTLVEFVRQARQQTGAPLILGVGNRGGMATGAMDSLFEATGATVLVETQQSQALAAASVAAIVRRLAPAEGHAGAAIIEIGPRTLIDLATRCIHRGESVQPLSPTEFRLLVALVRASGRPCSHDELVAKVWGSERVSGHHYLRLYVRYLRHKLEDDPKRPRLLQTVWGVGYRLLPSGRTAAITGAPITKR